MALTIGVDVGGTKIAAGLVDEQGSVVSAVRQSSPKQSGEALLDAVVAIVADLRAQTDGEIAGVGLSAAGFVSADRRHVIFAPHLQWGDEPVADLLSERTGLPVVIENDANAAAWAESRFGSGRGVDDQLMVAIGTGVGGGIVIDGEIYRGGHGVAAEIGHISFVPDGLPCPCGRRGCFEQYASGNALQRRAREAAADGRAPGLLEHAGGDPAEVTGLMVTTAAQSGDTDAVALLDGLGRDLGIGIASLVAVLDPALVVLGGGVSEAGELLRAPVERSLAEQVTGGARRPIPPVVVAAMGNDAALVGAADLARRGARGRQAEARSPQ